METKLQSEEALQSETASSGIKKLSSSAAKPKNKTSSAIKHYVSNTPSSKATSSKVATGVVSSSEPTSSEEEIQDDYEEEYEEEEQEPASKVSSTPKSENTSIVDLNTASKEEFMTLVGIGEVTAENIIAFREEIGSFASIEEIKAVKGIGDKTYDKIKHRLTV